jgi:hypothetical protein
MFCLLQNNEAIKFHSYHIFSWDAAKKIHLLADGYTTELFGQQA